jgi:hypothetical protein
MNSKRIFQLSLFVATVLFSLGSAAQTASLAGRVVDSSGAVIPGATVVIAKPGTALEITAVSDTNGVFAVNALRSGNYELTASAKGFGVRSRQVRVPSESSIELVLTPRAALEEVNVVVRFLSPTQKLQSERRVRSMSSIRRHWSLAVFTTSAKRCARQQASTCATKKDLVFVRTSAFAG